MSALHCKAAHACSGAQRTGCLAVRYSKISATFAYARGLHQPQTELLISSQFVRSCMQRRSVNWMLQREHCPTAIQPDPSLTDTFDPNAASCSSAPPPPPASLQQPHWKWLWRPVPSVLWPSNISLALVMNRDSGRMTQEEPEEPPEVLGGALLTQIRHTSVIV